MRRSRIKLPLAAAGLAAVAVAATAVAGGSPNFRGTLTGFQEVPAVSTSGHGGFTARVTHGGEAIEYRLSYDDLEGAVAQSHIHFGQRSVSGGVAAWLCSNLASPPTPEGIPPCPAPPATVTGRIEADDVVGPAGQGIAPGELSELLEAMHAGVTYANVHSDKFPGGEIRGQLRPGAAE